MNARLRLCADPCRRWPSARRSPLGDLVQSGAQRHGGRADRGARRPGLESVSAAMAASSRSATPPSSARAPMRTAILQQRFGCECLGRLRRRHRIGAAIGAAIGYLSFRSGLRGSYFALVTLAFAEVFRIVANASAFFGGAAGVLLKLDVRPQNFQFASRAAYLLDHRSALVGMRPDRHARDRALALRRLSRRDPRKRGCGEGARRRHAEGEASGDHALGRHHGRGRRVLCAVFPLRQCRHRLRHLDLDRSAARADHRRPRHRVRSADRRACAAWLGEVDKGGRRSDSGRRRRALRRAPDPRRGVRAPWASGAAGAAASRACAPRARHERGPAAGRERQQALRRPARRRLRFA